LNWITQCYGLGQAHSAALFSAVVALTGMVVCMVRASQADGQAAPIFGVKIPPGYRDWRLISVAHEAGSLNDLRP
jgi:hypothetical protein